MDLASVSQKIKKIKRQNGQHELQEKDTHADPFQQFLMWFDEVLDSGIYDPSAMVLGTVDQNGLPDTRVVLLKELELNRFIFFSNYHSKKAQDIESHPIVALNFYWPSLVRQVRMRGKIEKINHARSEAYFATRPREAQIGVYASNQSAEIENRHYLEEKFQFYAKTFSQTEKIPCPSFWGGYGVTPFEYEFFQGRPFRTHDRIAYVFQQNQWKKSRLSP